VVKAPFLYLFGGPARFMGISEMEYRGGPHGSALDWHVAMKTLIAPEKI
jgi:hypothetical protein